MPMLLVITSSTMVRSTGRRQPSRSADTITPGTNCTAVTVAGELEGKVDKGHGQAGSPPRTYTTAEKTKLSGIEAQANTVIDSTLTQAGQAADAKAAGDAVSD